MRGREYWDQLPAAEQEAMRRQIMKLVDVGEEEEAQIYREGTKYGPGEELSETDRERALQCLQDLYGMTPEQTAAISDPHPLTPEERILADARLTRMIEVRRSGEAAFNELRRQMFPPGKSVNTADS